MVNVMQIVWNKSRFPENKKEENVYSHPRKYTKFKAKMCSKTVDFN